MTTINGKACVVNGVPVDKVFSDGKQVYERNLVTGTSKEFKTVTRSGWGNSPTNLASGKYGAGRYHASAYIENTTPVGMKLYVGIYGDDGKFIYNALGGFMPAGKSGIASSTFNVSEGQLLNSVFVGFENLQTESYTYKYKEVMVKRTPIPWTPAPEDYI